MTACCSPTGRSSLEPATAVFHYAQEIFEGLKAYRQGGGPIVAFRPSANAARFKRSATRLAMPELPEAAFLRSIELLVSQDRDWVPTAEGHSLYLRPFMIATQRGLGVNHPSSSYQYTVIASPAGGVLQGRGPPGLGLAVRGLHPRRAGRHRRGEVRRQLRGRLRRADPGRPERL